MLLSLLLSDLRWSTTNVCYQVKLTYIISYEISMLYTLNVILKQYTTYHLQFVLRLRGNNIVDRKV